jgi:hypothetical protein
MEKYSKLSLIHPDQDIMVKSKRDKVVSVIVEQVNKYLKHFKDPADIKLVRFIATLIENLIKKKGIDKLGVFLEVLKCVFPDINADVFNRACQILEDLLSNGQIKRIPILKYGLHLAYELIKQTTKSFFLIEK